jgi:protein AroM
LKSVKIGLLTIGQSPRKDITHEIKPLISSHIEIIERGILDNLDLVEIQKLKPDKGEIPLVTILRNGKEVQLGAEKIDSLLPNIINEMQKKGKIKGIGILCTHDFHDKEYSIPVIFPSNFIKFLLKHILKINRLGIVIPLENQIDMVKEKFQSNKIIIQVKSPYSQEKSWEEIVDYFKKEKIDGIILDCIGYKIKDKQEIQDLIEIPVLLPRLILAHAINQLF